MCDFAQKTRMPIDKMETNRIELQVEVRGPAEMEIV